LPHHSTSTLFPYTTLFRSLSEFLQYLFAFDLHPCIEARQMFTFRAEVGVAHSPRLGTTSKSAVVIVEKEVRDFRMPVQDPVQLRSEEHTSELQSRGHLVCR